MPARSPDAPRWERHRSFVKKWRLPAFSKGTGWSAEDLSKIAEQVVQLPAALREWYSFAGSYFSRRGPLRGWHLTFASASDFFDEDTLYWAPIDEGLQLLAEDQSDKIAEIRPQDLGMPDPPVYCKLSGVRVSESTSAFFLGLLFNHCLEVWGTKEGTAGAGRRILMHGTGVARVVREVYRHVPVDAWRHLGSATFAESISIEFRGDADTLIRVDGEEWCWVATRSVRAGHAADQLLLAVAEPGDHERYMDGQVESRRPRRRRR